MVYLEKQFVQPGVTSAQQEVVEEVLDEEEQQANEDLLQSLLGNDTSVFDLVITANMTEAQKQAILSLQYFDW